MMKKTLAATKGLLVYRKK